MLKVKGYLSIILFFGFYFQLIAKEYNAEFILKDSYIEVKGNKIIESDTVVIQINNPQGDDYSSIQVVKFKYGESIKGWIEDMSRHVIRKLKDEDIVESNHSQEYSFEEDILYRKFELKHNVYPYRIVYVHSGSSDNFIGYMWKPISELNTPIHSARCTFTYPLGYTIHVDAQNIPKSNTDTNKLLLTNHWQVSYTNLLQDEDYADIDRSLPHVAIIPDKFIYGVWGNSQNWSTFGNWYFRLIHGLDELPESEKTKANQLVSGTMDTREKVRILYHYLQDQTRYINVSVGIDGLKPHPASYVVKYKYGDCKALSIYMKALLQAVNIKSNYTVVYGGENPPEIKDSIVGPHYFNHIILTVPIGNDTIWLDNTDNIGPFGYVNSFIQNRRALLIDEFHSHLIHIPAMKAYENSIHRKIDFTIHPNGNADVLYKILYKGENFEYFNFQNEDLNKDEKDKLVRDICHFPNFNLEEWNLIKKDRDSNSINLDIRLALDKFCDVLGKDFYFYLNTIYIHDFKNIKDRKLPVHIEISKFLIDSITYYFPENLVLQNLPENLSYKTKFGNYTLHFEIQTNKLFVVKTFELKKGDYELAQYADLYNFINEVVKKERTGIILSNK